MQQQLLEVDKMASLGQLTAGVVMKLIDLFVNN